MEDTLKERFEAILNEPANYNTRAETILQVMEQAYNLALSERWVDVKDRLPEKDGRYLAYVKAGSGLYEQGVHALIFDTHNLFGRATHKHVTNWMPLPTPPQTKD